MALVVSLVAVSAAAAAADRPITSPVKLKHGLTHFRLTTPEGGRAADYPLVVLVAGYAVPMVVWDDTVLPLVAKKFAVLRFDLYGRGQSARPRRDYDPALFAEQLDELIGKLELPRPFHVVASSMGGIVTAVFATRHPHALNRVVLVSPAGLSEKFPSMITLLKVPGVGPWYFRHWFKDIMLDHLKDNLATDYRGYPNVLAAFHRQLVVPGTADAMYSTLRRTLLRDSKEDFRGLGGLHRPTRVVWGTEDRLVPFAESRTALESAIPHHELCAVKRAAHLPQVEQQRLFNALVGQFLAGLSDEPFAPCDAGPLR